MVASRGEPGLGHIGTGFVPPTNSGARADGGRDPARRRQVAPGTAGTAKRWAAAEGRSRCTSALTARPRPAQRCPPRPAMGPPAPATLGLLLLLVLPPLPPGEAAKKATPCKRCRELVDKFNQVGGPRRGGTRSRGRGGQPGARGPAWGPAGPGPGPPRDGPGSPHHGPGSRIQGGPAMDRGHGPTVAPRWVGVAPPWTGVRNPGISPP